MAKTLVARAYNPVVNVDEAGPSDSARGRSSPAPDRRPLLRRLRHLGVTAPLNGAVVGNAVIKVEGNRKSVQHLDGGIVRKLLVKEGDRVEAGDVLSSRRQQTTRGIRGADPSNMSFCAPPRSGLLAELGRHDAIVVPGRPRRQQGRRPMPGRHRAGQVKQFDSRRAAIEGTTQGHRREDPRSSRSSDRRRRGPGQGLCRTERFGGSEADSVAPLVEKDAAAPVSPAAAPAHRLRARRPDRRGAGQCRQVPPGDRRAGTADRPARQRPHGRSDEGSPRGPCQAGRGAAASGRGRQPSWGAWRSDHPTPAASSG